jgi:hypothetical protein
LFIIIIIIIIAAAVVDIVVLGVLEVRVLATGHKIRGFKPRPRAMDFTGDKNLRQAYLQTGSKAVGPCYKILRHVKEPFQV